MKEPVNSYRDLRVWQEAMLLAETCYFVTKTFPRNEMRCQDIGKMLHGLIRSIAKDQ